MTIGEGGTKVNSDHLLVRYSDIFGDTAIVSKETKAEAEAKRRVKAAKEKKARADKAVAIITAAVEKREKANM